MVQDNNRRMKDSGIPWIGEIPSDWSSDMIGNLYTLRNEKVSDKDYPPLSVGKMGVVPQLETAAKTDDGDNRKLVRIGDFAINSRSDRRGSCGISNYDGSVSLINTILTPRGEMNPQYFNWFFHTEQFADEFYKWGHGIVDDLWTTRWQEMKRITISVPPLPTQQRIADFLDSKCAEIDELAALQETMIAELKRYKQSVITEAVTKGLDPNVAMKDSGVEWIGEIPEGWKIKKIKQEFIIIAGATPKSDDAENWDGDIPWITPADYTTEQIYVYGGKRNLSPKGYDSCSTSLLPQGCLIFSKRAPIGLVAINAAQLCTNQGCLGCVPKDSVFTKFVYYTTSVWTEQFELYGSGTTFKEISANNFANFKLAFPPLSEQRAIADYLDRKCAEIDELIAIKQQKIEALKEYKKSVIFEYVTGKKEVEG